jgi:hypothetical protein
MQSGGGIVDTGNQQTIDGDNQRAQWPTYMRSKVANSAIDCDLRTFF